MCTFVPNSKARKMVHGPQAHWLYSSFVIEVKASEIIPAGMIGLDSFWPIVQVRLTVLIDGNFAAGLTLRFPRVKYIRYDRASKPNYAKHDDGDGNGGDGDDKVWDAWDSVSR